MNTDSYTRLLAQPQTIEKSQLEELDAVLQRYPYFQSARALQLKGLKNENSFLYNDHLRLAAAYTTDRDILFEYITSDSFAQNEISQLILQHDERVMQMEVVEEEDVSESVSLQLDQQMKDEIKKAEAILDPALFERKEPPVPLEEERQESEPLQIDQPLPFTKKDTHSFAEWLKLTKAVPIDRSQEEATLQETSEDTGSNFQADRERKFELIEKFIQQPPKLTPPQNTGKNVNLAKPYTQTSDHLMTETLAKVYLQQKNYKKAIQAYKILILKNPEKSGFFADQIRAIQQLIKKDS